MNRYHPMIKNSLSEDDQVDDYLEMSKKHTVFQNKKFNTNIQRGPDYMTIKVKW